MCVGCYGEQWVACNFTEKDVVKYNLIFAFPSHFYYLPTYTHPYPQATPPSWIIQNNKHMLLSGGDAVSVCYQVRYILTLGNMPTACAYYHTR